MGASHQEKKGDYAWVQCRGQIFCDAEGKVDYISGITFDITEHKQAGEALLRRDAILAAVGFAAERCLQSTSWEENIQEILTRLGQAVTATRAYIFENCLQENGELLTLYQGFVQGQGDMFVTVDQTVLSNPTPSGRL
jgi:hypothetical protein